MSACACMGAMYGEPYCYCEMERRGFTKEMEENPLRITDNKQFEEAMKRAFEPGGIFYKINKENK